MFMDRYPQIQQQRVCSQLVPAVLFPTLISPSHHDRVHLIGTFTTNPSHLMSSQVPMVLAFSPHVSEHRDEFGPRALPPSTLTLLSLTGLGHPAPDIPFRTKIKELFPLITHSLPLGRAKRFLLPSRHYNYKGGRIHSASPAALRVEVTLRHPQKSSPWPTISANPITGATAPHPAPQRVLSSWKPQEEEYTDILFL